MVLPLSRNTTYVAAGVDVAGSMIKSDDLNDIQDQIVTLHAYSNGEKAVRTALSVWEDSPVYTDNPVAIWDDTISQWVFGQFTGAVFIGGTVRYPGQNWDSGTHPNPAYAATNPSIATDGAGTILIAFSQGTATAARILRTTDGGINWALQTVPDTSTIGCKVFWTGTVFLFMHTTGGVVYSSATGETGSWVAATSYFSSLTIKRGDSFGGVFAVAVTGVSGDDVLTTDDDGATWTRVDAGSIGAESVIYSPALGQWILSGDGIWFADDPAGTWTAQVLDVRAPSNSGPFYDMGDMGGILVARKDTKIMTSPDGLTWRVGLRTVTGSIFVGPRSVAFFEGATSMFISASV